MSQNCVNLGMRLYPTSEEISTDKLQSCACVVLTHLRIPVLVLNLNPSISFMVTSL